MSFILKCTILGANWVHLGSIHYHGIGEILLSIPKATPNNNPYHEIPDDGNLAKTKAEVTQEMGYTRHEVSDYQRMAQNQAVVNLVLEQADPSQKSGQGYQKSDKAKASNCGKSKRTARH